MTRLTLMLSSVVIFVLVNPTTAQTDTTFTYQGSLRDGGTPASGFYNMDFSLWDAPADGNQIGSSVMFNQLPVSEGLFTVELDFGANAFDNTGRWLEIAVNGNELSPRQPITRAPYSIQTRGIFVDEDQNVGIGTMAPDALVEIQADQNVTEYIHLSGFDNDNASIRPVFKFRRARGSAAVPAVVANGDRIGSIIAEAYDGATPPPPRVHRVSGGRGTRFWGHARTN